MRIRTFVKTICVVGLIAVTVSFIVTNADPAHTAQTAHLPEPPPPPPPAVDKFGIVKTGFSHAEGTIQRNQTLSEILTTHGLTSEEIHALVERTKGAFDFGSLQVGKAYRVYKKGDQPAYFVYQPDKINYVVVDLSESGKVVSKKRPVTVTKRTISGTIDGSLYGSIIDSGADPILAAKLVEVFQWQIDFYRIQKGDEFAVVYEDHAVDREWVGVGDILGARIVHEGQDFTALRYDEGDVSGYYDANGENLRRAFLKAPVKFSRISSRFSLRRFHPVQKRYKAHLGTDYAAPTGTPIVSTGDGVVVEAGYNRGNGNYVKVKHNQTYTTQYLHMSRIASGMRPGTRVKQGQTIGYVGSTGLATGPHVCYRFWKNGKQVDPSKESPPAADPIPDEHRQRFAELRDKVMQEINAVSNTNRPALAANTAPAAPNAN